jgi:hypothetical protein
MTDEQMAALTVEVVKLRNDVDHLLGLMTNVAAILLEMDIALGPDVPISDETRARFHSAVGVYHGHVQGKILEIASRVLGKTSGDPEE